MILDLNKTETNYLYMFLNKNEEPLYIGISKNLTTRIETQHFKSKFGNLCKECIEETYKILYHQATSEDDMKIKERYLINTLKPKYNNKMNNKKSFDYKIQINWQQYEFKKEELLEKRYKNETKQHLKFRNYNYDFESQDYLKLRTDRTIQTFYTCLFNLERDYPNIIFPKRRGGLGGYNSFEDDFHFLKINNELFIFCYEILNFYESEYTGFGELVHEFKDINKLRNEYGIDSFVIVSSKEKKGIFAGDHHMHKLPNEILFMKYDVLKKTELLDKEWEQRLDKALINFKKPHYEWLVQKCLTKQKTLAVLS